MKLWLAICLTAVLVFICILVPLLSIPIVLGTTIWIVEDSKKLGLQRYKSGIALRPVLLFLGVLLLWVVGFPWYLSVRYKVKRGLVPLKEQYRSEGGGDE